MYICHYNSCRQSGQTPDQPHERRGINSLQTLKMRAPISPQCLNRENNPGTHMQYLPGLKLSHEITTF